MSALLVTLLLINAAFNILVWPTFYRRVAKDPRARDTGGKPTKFLIVHAVLIAIALAIAAASIVGVIVVLA